MHKKPPPPRTLQEKYGYGPMEVLRGVSFSYERGTPVVACLYVAEVFEVVNDAH